MPPLPDDETLSELERLLADATEPDIEQKPASSVRITFSQVKLLQASIRHAKALIAEVRAGRKRETEIERIARAYGVHAETYQEISWWQINHYGMVRPAYELPIELLGLVAVYDETRFPTRSACDDAIIKAVAEYEKGIPR